MRNRNIIRSLSLAAILAAGFLVLWAASPSRQEQPCNESMDGCCKQEKQDKMSWETVPHQFFSSLSID